MEMGTFKMTVPPLDRLDARGAARDNSRAQGQVSGDAGVAFYGSPPGNHSVATGHDFVIDLNDTATLELITFANVLAKEMFPDP